MNINECKWDNKGNYHDDKGRFAESPYPIPWKVRASGQKRIVEARELVSIFINYKLAMVGGLDYSIKRPCCGRLAKVRAYHYGIKVDNNGNWMAPEFRISKPDRVCQPCAFPWSVTIDEDKRRWSVSHVWEESPAEVPFFYPNFKIEGTPHWATRNSPAEMVLASTPPSVGS